MTTTTHGPTDTTTPIFPIFPIFPISPISPISLISTTTLISLLSTLTLLLAAIFLSRSLLPSPALRTHHLLLPLHTWHLFDFLIHTLLEGSFLYHSFFSYTTLLPHDPPPPSDYPHPASLRTPSTNANSASFLGHSNRRYGAEHSAWPTARLWQEYARADKRWANTDTNIISIELLTVFVAAPLALYICHLLQHQSSPSSSSSLPPPPQRPSRNPNIVKPHSQRTANHSNAAKLWFSIIILATAEIYGGFMTFAPEWLTGNTALQTGDWMYLWLYLVFFNGLWVVMPAWCLWVAWAEIGTAFREREDRGSRDGEGKKGR